jgi:hypothetical protein
MLDLLDVLARSGLTLGLLSNIPLEIADEFLQRHAWLGRSSIAGGARFGRGLQRSLEASPADDDAAEGDILTFSR